MLYFNGCSYWVVAKGNPKNIDPNNACGLKVAVQKGTVQVDDLTARSKKCTDAGKAEITPLVDPDRAKSPANNAYHWPNPQQRTPPTTPDSIRSMPWER